MFEACVTSRFVATHRLRRPDGSTEELHEHQWHVRVTYAGPHLDDMGLLVDFGALHARLDAALAELNEQDLNHLPLFAQQNPTAEHVAVYVAGRLPHELPGAARLTCVEVEEEAGCYARYFPPPHAAVTQPCG